MSSLDQILPVIYASIGLRPQLDIPVGRIRVIVCGGRDYRDRDRLFRELDWIHTSAAEIVELAQGAAPGADFFSEQWAIERGVPVVSFPADWNRWGPAAGPRRNQQMLTEFKPDWVIAFPGGRGTADMIRRARAAGVKLHIVQNHK